MIEMQPGEHKFSVFVYESAGIAEELAQAEVVVEHVRAGELGHETEVDHAGSVDDAAAGIDSFRARSCGSDYDVAVFNLNGGIRTKYPALKAVDALFRVPYRAEGPPGPCFIRI